MPVELLFAILWAPVLVAIVLECGISPGARVAVLLAGEITPFGLKAVKFPGGNTNDHFSNRNGTSPPNPSGGIGLAGWINAETLSGRGVLATYHDAVDKGLFFETNGAVLRAFVDGAGVVLESSTATLSTGSWFFVGVTYDNSTTLKFYIGAYDATGATSLTVETKTVTQDVPDYTGAEYTLGGVVGNVDGIDGDMSEWNLWSGAPTQAVLEEIYNGGKGLAVEDFSAAAEVGLLTNHKFDDASGSLTDYHTAGPYNLALQDDGANVTYDQTGPGG